jgi:hypothetical protein
MKNEESLSVKSVKSAVKFLRLRLCRAVILPAAALTVHNQIFNPKGIVSVSPALARLREGLRWVAAREGPNPERVAYQRLMEEMQPFQGW